MNCWSIRIQLGIMICCALCCGLVQNAVAAERTENAAASPKTFATVWRISGKVTVSGRDAIQSRELHVGDEVYVGELMIASSTGEAVLITQDKGMIAIRPKTEFLAEYFTAEGKSTDSFSIRVLTGSLRVISGWISHINRSGARIVTPSATIGIRGTDHEPYVLSAELAAATSDKAGTYDKVNRGGTTMRVGDKMLDIEPGKVGFVRATSTSNVQSRALMTLLLPVLLDKVPSFYVPGKFDAELDQFSLTADQTSQLELEQKQQAVTPPLAANCDAPVIAEKWLTQLDTAIAHRDAQTVISLFAPEAAVHATVRESGGKMASIDLGREEFSQSTVDAMKGLKEYKQRRVSTKASESNTSGGVCNRISIKSVVIEQGIQAKKRFRFESLEEYVLELRDGKWLSIRADTTQQ